MLPLGEFSRIVACKTQLLWVIFICTHLIWLGHLSTAYVTRRGQSCVASISEGYVIPTPTILSQSITVIVTVAFVVKMVFQGTQVIITRETSAPATLLERRNTVWHIFYSTVLRLHRHRYCCCLVCAARSAERENLGKDIPLVQLAQL